MLALMKRNFLLYFRNRSGVLFSLLGALISFGLYIIFLQEQLENSWSQIPDSASLLNNWLMSGTLAVTAITTSLASLTQLVKDREHQVDQDLFLTGLGKWGLYLSYLLSAVIVSFVMQLLMYGLMCLYFRESPAWSSLPELFLIAVLGSLLTSLVNFLCIFAFQSVDSLGKFSTLVGTAAGFLVGTYVPLGLLPSFAQILVKCTPATYIASLYRQILMKDQLTKLFPASSSRLADFESQMGIRIEWQELLTREQTYLIVVGGILVALLIWGGLITCRTKK